MGIMTVYAAGPSNRRICQPDIWNRSSLWDGSLILPSPVSLSLLPFPSTLPPIASTFSLLQPHHTTAHSHHMINSPGQPEKRVEEGAEAPVLACPCLNIRLLIPTSLSSTASSLEALLSKLKPSSASDGSLRLPLSIGGITYVTLSPPCSEFILSHPAPLTPLPCHVPFP
jgi:hypothetical protein